MAEFIVEWDSECACSESTYGYCLWFVLNNQLTTLSDADLFTLGDYYFVKAGNELISMGLASCT